ncbi:hypothetical protein BDV09DRAFT_164023 [Aspergillus tetrazonus]
MGTRFLSTHPWFHGAYRLSPPQSSTQIQRYGSTPGFLAGPIMVVRAFCSGFPVFRSPDELIIVAFVLLANSFRLIFIFFLDPGFSSTLGHATPGMTGMTPILATSIFSGVH